MFSTVLLCEPEKRIYVCNDCVRYVEFVYVTARVCFVQPLEARRELTQTRCNAGGWRFGQTLAPVHCEPENEIGWRVRLEVWTDSCSRADVLQVIRAIIWDYRGKYCVNSDYVQC